MSDASSPDPVKKLVGWIIVLAIAATTVAFLVYFFLILPAKTGHVPPANMVACNYSANMGCGE